MRRPIAFLLIVCLTAVVAFAQTKPATTTTTASTTPVGGLKDTDFLAICGDSITEQKLYSLYIEDYLLMCRPHANLRAMQFGWGGEVVG